MSDSARSSPTAEPRPFGPRPRVTDAQPCCHLVDHIAPGKQPGIATSSGGRSYVDPSSARYCYVMHEHTYTTALRMRSGTRSRLILPASIAEVRAALEARVAKAPDDIAARISLCALTLSVSPAAT